MSTPHQSVGCNSASTVGGGLWISVIPVATSTRPYTSPESCSIGTGFVPRLTMTVTATQISQLHSARYRFSAIGFALGDIAMYRKAPTLVCTHTNIPIEEADGGKSKSCT